ncbi:MAG: M14 family metallopeptidase [Daejeonella sp.]|uniref:M14 family metallopeptidase n=1 Tax=Daejeonella sp. TaxID=2805397 RepID=UPI002734FB55|nr:M14 family metallopeptidase [Daejeonella sp.]MDP3466972.1 M14 family metallopeptidase [Daejeonella sp.]
MKKYFILLLFLTGLQLNGFAQKIQSPSEFLGYRLGDQFTPHYRVLEYYKYLASVSKNIKLQDYGKTNEGRPLFLAFVGSDSNISRLEEIRKNNMKLTGIKDGLNTTVAGEVLKDQPILVWFSYNVHGNESVSTEASLQTVFDLLDPSNSRTKEWLKNSLLILDPCLNPDGRERYVNFYNPIKNSIPDALPFAREHMEPWPGGRSNHYYFDLNRDWVWQSQVESQQRLAVYNQWLPQVHVDFHEQGINNPYYFAPAAEPYHQDISKWQREFQTIIGKNNARYFDQNGWMYFTRENFDLLYPSYGDTYPVYNGSIGMTYEQGGSGRAGLAVINAEGDTLTLKDRIDHHHTSGLSTLEAASQNAEQALIEFKNYFTSSKSNPPGVYKSYIIKGDNTEKIKSLATLLQRNGIEFGFGIAKGAQGYNYFNGKTESFRVEQTDMVLSAHQPKSVLLKVLFEPNTFVSDSATYDITAWSLPYAHGLQAYATKESIKPETSLIPESSVSAATVSNPVAYIANWNSIADVKFLAELLNNGIKVRYSEIPFETSGRRFNSGSLIITRNGNSTISSGFEKTVNEIAKKTGISLFAIPTAYVDKGADLGSSKVRFIKKPRVVVVGGETVSSLSLGEIWHFFEQEIGYPVTIVRPQDLNMINWNEFDVLIFPDGKYSDMGNEKMLQWIRGGGKLIAMKNAVSDLAGKRGFDLKNKDEAKKEEKNIYEDLKAYEQRERENVSTNIPGAIYKIDLDNTHPLGFGFPNFYYTLKLDDKVYKYLTAGWNVGTIKKDNYVTGFVGVQAKKKLADGLIFGVQEMGNGSVVYMADNPLFRGFWENGKLLFSNAVFMVGH